MGLKPVQSCLGICVINNRPSLMDDAARGIVMARGIVDSCEDTIEGSGDDMTAICKMKRKGVANAFIGRFSIGDAKKAGLLGKQPWQAYPRDMLRHRASSRALKMGFSDALMNLPIKEDIEDVPPEKREATALPEPDPLFESNVIEVKPESLTKQVMEATGGAQSMREAIKPSVSQKVAPEPLPYELQSIVGKAKSITVTKLDGVKTGYKIVLESGATLSTPEDSVIEYLKQFKGFDLEFKHFSGQIESVKVCE